MGWGWVMARFSATVRHVWEQPSAAPMLSSKASSIILTFMMQKYKKTHIS